MKSKIDYSIYLVTDRSILEGRDLYYAIEQSILGGATLVQLREKNISTLEFYKIAVKAKKVTDKYHLPLIINDRVDIALAVDAAGVHLGQSDMNCIITRKLIGNNKIIGISATTLDEAMVAQEDGADYIGVGAIFPTETKTDADIVNVEILKNIKMNLHIPVVAIGGINENNVMLLSNTGIDGVAVISAIIGKYDVKAATEKFKYIQY